MKPFLRYRPSVCGRASTALILLLVTCAPGRVSAADVFANAAKARDKYLADIDELAKWCEENNLADEARKTRHALAPHDSDKLYVPVLPQAVGPAKLPDDAPAQAAEWQTRFGRLRHNYAVAAYEIARHAVSTGRAALAFELVLAAVEADPDYEPVRRVLGYQKFRDQWHTFHDVRKLRAGFVWSEKFGWISKPFLRRYEEGQRRCDGRWITAAEDARRHSDIASGWIVETEHYSIRTDHSIEAAVALGVKLECLYHLWAKIFIRYYASEADVVALFDGRNRTQITILPRHKVVYLRDRQDYDRSLKQILPGFGTEGIYYNGTAYFFPNRDGDDRTLYHEATHQLFHESRPVARDVGGKANFWIVEGIAMYMESLRQADGYYILGGFQDERMQAARYRLLHDHFYVPLAEFTAYGRERLQADPRIKTLYSQAAGLTNFFVYYQDGRYRDGLVQYLSTVYSGEDDARSLARLTGVDYNELDKQYREFLTRGGSESGKPKAESGKAENGQLTATPTQLLTSH